MQIHIYVNPWNANGRPLMMSRRPLGSRKSLPVGDRIRVLHAMFKHLFEYGHDRTSQLAPLLVGFERDGDEITVMERVTDTIERAQACLGIGGGAVEHRWVELEVNHLLLDRLDDDLLPLTEMWCTQFLHIFSLKRLPSYIHSGSGTIFRSPKHCLD